MNPIGFALRRPKSVLVGLISLVLIGASVIRPKSVDDWLKARGVELPIKRMAIDIFPSLNLPVIYVCQPYGGMDPAQMEGLITNYYEYHFLYINGIHHVESRNVQGTALMKLIFHPGTNMAQAMAETINYVNRSRAMMPPGTVPPFVMRFDTGSVPVGYLVLSSGTKTIAEIQDQALFKVRPLFSSLPGVSAPPPFGGSARSIVVRANPDRLRAFGVSPDDVIGALTRGNTISPSGNVRLGDYFPAVPSNVLVKDIRDLGQIPLKTGSDTVYLRDIGTIEDSADMTTGYALVNGRRAVYILATKRADASTMNVIDEIKRAIPSMQKELPDDIQVAFEFDQSPYVTQAISSLTYESLLGAFLTGLMVLLFLRDWRSALVVVANIPLAILFSIVCLWLTGQTINLMTLGGLALAVGILVDEATVEIENIHTQLGKTPSVAMAVWNGNHQTAIPRFLAMLCILAVFVPTLFMQGAARELFYPLSLAVGFAMIGSYVLSSTLVPILCIWLLRARPHQPTDNQPSTLVRLFDQCIGKTISLRWVTVPAYVAICGLLIVWMVPRVGVDIFPNIDAGEFRVKLRAQDGTHIDVTEKIATQVLDSVAASVGQNKIALSLGYVGTVPASFPINAVYQFTRGPEEAILRIAFKPHSGVDTEKLKAELRSKFASQFPNIRFSLEPSDIISEVMSFGSSTPIEVAIRGGSLAENKDFAKKTQSALQLHPRLRDVQIVQSLDYPTVDVRVDREKSGLAGASMDQIGRSILAATSSSRFVVPNYWPDPKSGIGYQVQVEIPQPSMKSLSDLGTVPVLHLDDSPLLLRDVAQITQSTMPGEFDRYNMKRELSVTANLVGSDLGGIANELMQILDGVKKEDDGAKDLLVKAGEKPGRITYEIRGQIPPLRQMLSGLGIGLLLAVLAIFLLLAANFQSFRLSLVAISTFPAVIAGSVLMLWCTGTTLNIQSFIGTIMGLGVAMANAILVVTFSEQRRMSGEDAMVAAQHAATDRLRPVLMTSCAMLAGMLPLAIGLGDSGQQTAPLGLAVIGSLLAATISTLFILPAVFALIQSNRTTKSASLHPLDSQSNVFIETSNHA